MNPTTTTWRDVCKAGNGRTETQEVARLPGGPAGLCEPDLVLVQLHRSAPDKLLKDMRVFSAKVASLEKNLLLPPFGSS